ncbi:hypothetical protein OG978_47090 (plasmid) [Streptomyces sp. NBC_01591]|nr:hypothetical protein [Streptomyces sp. NBC_01591]WSD66054.1 hypothetical protein OG978_00330 [Streptomyces sp. NBC_01591]WSD73064.1 hypothetical protein OG978_40495 [Streptomyces sp. NBC_01591]WSD73661.1 hypothetical protein OG978_41150 [Streptomyces sp. NBC_01591]WSD74552.1 hypothetical protein OG978_47090 [Streptomyces sp. NBC_01591]
MYVAVNGPAAEAGWGDTLPAARAVRVKRLLAGGLVTIIITDDW